MSDLTTQASFWDSKVISAAVAGFLTLAGSLLTFIVTAHNARKVRRLDLANAEKVRQEDLDRANEERQRAVATQARALMRDRLEELFYKTYRWMETVRSMVAIHEQVLNGTLDRARGLMELDRLGSEYGPDQARYTQVVETFQPTLAEDHRRRIMLQARFVERAIRWRDDESTELSPLVEEGRILSSELEQILPLIANKLRAFYGEQHDNVECAIARGQSIRSG